MDTFQIILQIIAALGLLNVWVLRISKKTPYRGKGAASMRREFEGRIQVASAIGKVGNGPGAV
jgi:hypothetical protein